MYKKHSFDLYSLLENYADTINALTLEAFRRKKPICVLPDSDSSEESIVVRERLKSLSRNIQKLEDETGLQYCYLGFPFLEGHMTKDHYLRGPLVLFPISLTHGRKGRGKRGWYVEFTRAPIVNHTLFAALRKIGGYDISDALTADIEEMASSPDPAHPESMFVERLSTILRDSGLPLALPDTRYPVPVNGEDGSATLNITTQLKDITADEMAAMSRQQLRISHYKIIGSFPQGESAIYQDYDEMILRAANGGLGGFITEMLGESTPSSDLDNESVSEDELDRTSDVDLNLILNSDSSQDLAVLSSQKQKITLVSGPPGTGKSQVIVNMISNALAKRQTVLVVCQKRAALEVVHQRLAEKALDWYTVLLNRESEDRKRMYARLKAIIDQAGNNGVDKTGEIQATSKHIDDLISKHREMAEALSETHFGGITVRDLYAKASPRYQRQLDLHGIANNIPYPELNHILDEMSQAESGFKKFENSNYPWKSRTDFSGKSFTDMDALKEALATILSSDTRGYIIRSDLPAQERLISLTHQYSNQIVENIEIESEIKKHVGDITEMTGGSGASWPPGDLDDFVQRVEAGAVLWEQFGDRRKISYVQERHIAEDNRAEQLRLIDAFSEAETSRWKRLTDRGAQRRHKIREEFYNRPAVSSKSSSELKEMLDNGLELLILAEGHPFSRYVLNGAYLTDDGHRQKLLLQSIKGLVDAKARLSQNTIQLRSTRESLERDEGITLSLEAGEEGWLVSEARNGLDILKAVETLSKFLTDAEADTIRRKASVPEDLLPHVRRMYDHVDDFDEMQAHDARKGDLTSTQRTILERCAAVMSTDENWIANIREEIYLHWIEVIEQKRPVLKAGRFEDYEQNRTRLASLLEKKSDLVVDQIITNIGSIAGFKPGQGRRRTNRDAEYNTLKHELGRKRRVKPVRKLLRDYEHILMDLAPCWLASPEMVSNIFPMEEIFDLIIVDEASQLAAERALPFLQRGSRLVIAGDAKQLKPNDLFQIIEDDEDDYIVDAESLLDLSAKRYPTISLRWHYRSKWQELIDFSNHAFYHGILQVSPNSERYPPSPPIQWIRCEAGLWENRSNLPEADAVVDTIHSILRDHREDNIPTMGVITFNDQQRNVIMDRIEERRRDDRDFNKLYEKIESPESGKKDDEIFVRNIENVQGDERDIIIFSVGYARGADGNIRLNFGSLNREAGENRLNVAITRASQKIIVICSMDPADMKAEGAKNPGPRRLKEFLRYAQAVGEGDADGAKGVLDALDSGMRINMRPPVSFDSEFECMVYDRLVRLGYQVDTQVGQSGYKIDLAVAHPLDENRYVLGIECDGAAYHSAKSVRERDVMRQKFLERRGWEMERIWSRNWWRNPDREVDRIKERIDSLVRK